jgi:hypothetical protein
VRGFDLNAIWNKPTGTQEGLTVFGLQASLGTVSLTGCLPLN